MLLLKFRIHHLHSFHESAIKAIGMASIGRDSAEQAIRERQFFVDGPQIIRERAGFRRVKTFVLAAIAA